MKITRFDSKTSAEPAKRIFETGLVLKSRPVFTNPVHLAVKPAARTSDLCRLSAATFSRSWIANELISRDRHCEFGRRIGSGQRSRTVNDPAVVRRIDGDVIADAHSPASRVDELIQEIRHAGNKPPALFRDHVIEWSKDLRRSLDYLETRKDIDSSKVAYFGSSMGGVEGPVMAAVDSRIK